MAVSVLLAASFIMNVVAGFFLICAVALILTVLIQKGRGGGLSGVLGGGMASGILGSKTGDFLTWVTIVLVSMFLTLAVVMAKFYKPEVSDYGEGQGTRPSVQQQQAQPTEAQSPIDDLGGSEGTDTNLPGVR